MEDFPAHSNFCELALINMGYDQVYAHVGENVRIRAPNGKDVAPLVTGEYCKCVPMFSLNFLAIQGHLVVMISSTLSLGKQAIKLCVPSFVNGSLLIRPSEPIVYLRPQRETRASHEPL
jgi:hypothetical protein